MEALETRERLLDAAEVVFRERGVTRTSLAEVATAAGMTRGAVYWHFKDKADLFRAMCDRATLPLDAMFERAGATASADPLATLRALCVGALQRLADRSAHADGLRDHLPQDRAGRRTGRHRHVAPAGALPVPGADRGDHPRAAPKSAQLPADIDAALATQGLNALMVGIMHEWVLDPSAYDLAAAAPALIDAFLAGLATRPPRRAPRAPCRASGRRPRRLTRASRPARVARTATRRHNRGFLHSPTRIRP